MNKVLTGEYLSCFIDRGDIYYHDWKGYTTPILTKLNTTDKGNPIGSIVAGHGGQYSCVAIDVQGKPYILQLNQDTVDCIEVAFTGATDIIAIFDMYIAIREEKVWVFGNDYLNINGGKYITSPIQLGGSAKIKALSAGMTTGKGDCEVCGLATDGTVWKWRRGSATPVQVTFPGNKAKAITHVNTSAFVVYTTNDDIYAWGLRAYYVGLPWDANTPRSIKKQYTDAGAVFPLKQVIGNYNTLHVIDANGNMFGQGENINGEVGNGYTYDWVKNPKKLTPYNAPWTFTEYQPVVRIADPGHGAKWSEIFASNSIAFYLFAKDTAGNLFSWGRNKALVLGNGITLPAFGTNAYDKLPNALDMGAPSFVNVYGMMWNVIRNFDPKNPPKQTPVPAPDPAPPAPDPEPEPPAPPVKQPVYTVNFHDNPLMVNGMPVSVMTIYDDHSWSDGDGSMQ